MNDTENETPQPQTKSEKHDKSTVSQATKIRDRLLRASRWKLSKCNLRNKTTSNEALRLALAKQFVQDLEEGKPAGLIHVSAWSYATNTPVKIRTVPSLLNDSTETLHSDTVVVEYHQPTESQENLIGHWTLPGDKDPSGMEVIPNGCLFSVLASVSGKTTREVKTDLIGFLKRNITQIAANMDDILWLNENYQLLSMEGGARYVGNSQRDAKNVIDNSQNQPCHGYSAYGHPRGHASHPSATGPNDSVENYSMGGWKTGFLSRSDQDWVGHLALSHPQAQQGMNRLNNGSASEAVHISADSLGSDLPPGREYSSGAPQGEARRIHQVTLVLRHHAGQQNDPDADVFVHTFYPRL